MRVNQYENGVVIAAASFFGQEGDEIAQQETADKMQELLSDIVFYKHKVALRALGTENNPTQLDGVTVTGTSGGDGGAGSLASGISDAKKLFKNATMTVKNWEKVEEMIKKIKNDCMGGELFKSLESSFGINQINIQFAPGTKSTFDWNGNNRTITLGTGADSDSFLHEMLHAYQSTSDGGNATTATFEKALINNEIESRYAEYTYWKRHPDVVSIHGDWTGNEVGRSIRELNRYVTPKGTIVTGISNDALDSYLFAGNNSPQALLENVGSIYRDKNGKSRYDYSRVGVDNFKNINKLSKKC
ncbi:hypothetical protein AGMMS49525_16430 [Bacteroidia bacterium]|nr:hypothetical protein AGMMS49525_16430 [Bacteroidia bacterium]